MGRKIAFLFERYSALLIFPLLAMLLREYSRQIAAGNDGWRTGDWLINYSAGPVRRGMLGSLFLWLNDVGLPLVWSVFTVQALLYAVLYALVFKLYRATDRRLVWLLLLLNPAFILFPLYDPPGGFRKEIIIFVAFAGLCLAYATRKYWTQALVAGLLLFVLGCFAHEGNALALPFFLYVIWRGYKDGLQDGRKAAAVGVIFTLTGILAVAFSATYRGDSAIAAGICQSLRARGLDATICDGAIAWLDKGTGYGWDAVRTKLGYYLRGYSLAFCLALAPLSLIKGWRFETKAIFVLGFAGLLPLYFVAVDWGRWIHIFVFFVSCYVMAEGARNRLQARFEFMPLPFALIYLVSWSIPHCGNGSLDQGFWAFAYQHTVAKFL